jgi:hypothetical protein
MPSGAVYEEEIYLCYQEESLCLCVSIITTEPVGGFIES